MSDLTINIYDDLDVLKLCNISNEGIIELHRGDTFSFPLYINIGHKLGLFRYNLKENDKVYFALLEPNQPFEEAVVRKVFTKNDCNEHNDIMIKLESKDTINLESGIYYYEIKIETENGVSTIIPRTKFYIQE